MAASKKTIDKKPAAKRRAPGSKGAPAKPAAPKPAAAPATRPVPTAKPKAAKAKPQKPAKVKLVRDSFTIPKNEYAAIEVLKKRAAAAGLPSKKSELLRAGLMALSAMGDGAFQSAMSSVPTLKTGRPKKSKTGALVA